MAIQEQLNRQMAKISEQIDLNNDSFANLFSKNPKHQKQGPRSRLAQRLRQAQIERMDMGTSPNTRRRKVRGQPHPNKSQPGFQVLLIPAGVVMITVLFATGYLGAKLANNGFKSASHLPVTGQQVQTSQAMPLPDKSLVETTVSAASVLPSQNVTPISRAKPPETAVKKPERTVLKPLVQQKLPAKNVEQVAVVTKEIVATDTNTPVIRPRATTLLDKGHLREQEGDLPAARNYFQQAFENGSLAAALAIGRTFDPQFVREVTGTTQQANAGLARKWYEKWYLTAIENGEVSSRIRFDRLVRGLEVR